MPRTRWSPVLLLPALAILVLGGAGWAGGLAPTEASRGAGPVPGVGSEAAVGPAQEGPALVILVRHAEKAEEPADDPPLSPAGAARAEALAALLADAGITRIHTSDTRRTRETVAPLAARLGIQVELYNPRNLEETAARLRHLPGRHLVVGHSNTTDVLSGLLGGATHGEIVEAWEYDRLYLLTPRPDLPGTRPGSGGFETVLLRFGAVTSPPTGG